MSNDTMRHYIITLLLALSAALGTFAQGGLPGKYNMMNINMVSGMPSNFIDDIYQDSNGFMWFSTHGGGLVRYDGFSYLSFGVNGKGVQLRSNSSRNVYEDKFKRLWVAFEEGFQVMSLNTLQPVSPKCATKELAEQLLKLQQERCSRVYCDTKGAIWLITAAKICRIAFDTEGTINSILGMSYTSSAPDLAIQDLYNRGTVVMGYGGVIREISAKGNRLTTRDISAQFPKLNGQFVGAMINYNGKIWIGTNAGLFNNGSGRNVYHHTPDNSQLQHDNVTSLSISPTGNLLVGTLCGVDIINDKTGKIEHWNCCSAVNPLSSNFVNTIYSKNGQIWVGTETGGVCKLTPRQLKLTNYYHDANVPGSISQNAVNAIYTEPDGTLWVGVVEGGLNVVPPHSTQFKHYNTGNTNLSHNSVSVIAPDGMGQLWIGTWGGGVNIVTSRNPVQITRLKVDAAHQQPLTFIGAMIYDHINKGMWIGANEGVFFYNMKTGQLENPFPDNGSIRGNIGCIITRDNHLLMGCLDGMTDIELKSRKGGRGHFKMKHYTNKLDNPQSGILDKILCLYETNDGIIWAGSNGYGLYQCKRASNGGLTVIKNYTETDGLANNMVKGITVDNREMLWVATSYGLSLLNPATGAFNNFYSRDGLLCSQFYFNATTRDRQGTIYLGSEKGLTAIKGEQPATASTGSLKFTSLRVDNQDIFADGKYIDEDISIAKEIRLHESDRSFTIDFSALNYGSETQGAYSYCMEGFEDEWIKLPPGHHSVRYSTLPAGNYNFKVKYLPSIGSTKEQTISVKVHVTPYFWKSWWFILLIVAGLTAMVHHIYKRRLEQMREREVEILYRPIEAALKNSDEPGKLQSQIQTILETQRRYQESQKKTVEADKKEMAENTKPFMDSVMEVMEQNYRDSKFGVQELADALGVSRTVLGKNISSNTGLPPIQFIRNYRLDIAKRMMNDNAANRNIAEIAYRVGFNDPKYFTRCFTKFFGVAPSAYIDTLK